MGMTSDELAVVDAACHITRAAALPYLGAPPPGDPCCREDRLWRVFSLFDTRGAGSWGRLEGSMRMRARLHVDAVSLHEDGGALVMRVLPQSFKTISVTIGFANPEIG